MDFIELHRIELHRPAADRSPRNKVPGKAGILICNRGPADIPCRPSCEKPLRDQNSCDVGRYRISLMSNSSGWLIANATTRAKESTGMA